MPTISSQRWRMTSRSSERPPAPFTKGSSRVGQVAGWRPHTIVAASAAAKRPAMGVPQSSDGLGGPESRVRKAWSDVFAGDAVSSCFRSPCSRLPRPGRRVLRPPSRAVLFLKAGEAVRVERRPVSACRRSSASPASARRWPARTRTGPAPSRSPTCSNGFAATPRAPPARRSRARALPRTGSPRRTRARPSASLCSRATHTGRRQRSHFRRQSSPPAPGRRRLLRRRRSRRPLRPRRLHLHHHLHHRPRRDRISGRCSTARGSTIRMPSAQRSSTACRQPASSGCGSTSAGPRSRRALGAQFSPWYVARRQVRRHGQRTWNQGARHALPHARLGERRPGRIRAAD